MAATPNLLYDYNFIKGNSNGNSVDYIPATSGTPAVEGDDAHDNISSLWGLAIDASAGVYFVSGETNNERLYLRGTLRPDVLHDASQRRHAVGNCLNSDPDAGAERWRRSSLLHVGNRILRGEVQRRQLHRQRHGDTTRDVADFGGDDRRSTCVRSSGSHCLFRFAQIFQKFPPRDP